MRRNHSIAVRLREYFVEAIETSTMVSITYDDLEKIYSSSHKMEKLGRLVITFTMVVKDRWQMNMIKLTPRERFIDFVHKNPDLLQRVPSKISCLLFKYSTRNI
jgi:CRP-like cAMP-binding protein